MFVKINTNEQDWFVNLDQIQSVRSLGAYFQLIFRDGEQIRLDKATAAAIVAALPVPNGQPALSL